LRQDSDTQLFVRRSIAKAQRQKIGAAIRQRRHPAE
jgi:hypothetical protein